MTYEQIVEHYQSKGMSPADAVAKAQRFVAANPDKVEGPPKVEARKTQDKAPEKGKNKNPAEGRKPAGSATVPPPKSPPPPGAKVYGAEPPDKYREYVDTAPPVTIRKPEPEVSLMGRGGLWLDREAAAKAQAEDARRQAMNAPMVMEETVITAPPPPGTARQQMPSVTRYAPAPSSVADAVLPPVRDYSKGGGWAFTTPREVPAMREALRKIPKYAALVDDADEDEVREVYGIEFGGKGG